MATLIYEANPNRIRENGTYMGRRRLMTDEREVTSANIGRIVSKAYIEHQDNVLDETFLFSYVRGDQEILRREKPIRKDINERVVVNKASQIVDIHAAYCFSNPIKYIQNSKVEPGDEDGADVDDSKVSMLNKMMREQCKGTKDLELARNLFICGVAYQAVLPSRDKRKYAPFEIMVPNPLTTFVVYSNDAYREPKVACTYSVHEDGTISLTAYSDRLCFTMERKLDTDTFMMANESSVTPNVLGVIPIVEFALHDRMGIFERAIPLLNAINLVDSDRVNDIAQHVQSLLWMHNCQLDGEGKQNLVDGDGVIMTKSNGDGKEAKIAYLAQALDQTQIQYLVDHFIDEVEQITSTPSWKEASGGSTTGAMQLSNGWQSLELYSMSVEQLFIEPETRILEAAIEIIKADKRPYDGLKDIEASDIEIRFCPTRKYDLVSKTNSLVSLINAGVDGLTAFSTVGLFTDAQQAWCDSKRIIEKIQEKMAGEGEQPRQAPLVVSPNAFKDEEGNGGENNEPKDATEESMQPSKVAGVDE